MSRNSAYPYFLIAGFVGLSALLLGCTNTLTPNLDASFGNAVRASRQSQTLNPEAGTNRDPVLGLDGKSAVTAITNYQSQEKAAAQSGFIVNLGSSSGQ